MLKSWTPSSWQAKPALQQPNYRDPAALAAAVAALGRLPPIVVSWEIDALKAQLAELVALLGPPRDWKAQIRERKGGGR